MKITTPSELDAYLIEQITLAIRHAERLVFERRLSSPIGYTAPEAIGLFTTYLRSILSSAYFTYSEGKKAMENLCNVQNYIGIGEPNTASPYGWSSKITLPAGEWTLHASKAFMLLEIARQQTTLVDDDLASSLKAIDESMQGTRREMPRMQRIIMEMDVLNAEHDRLTVEIAALSAK